MIVAWQEFAPRRLKVLPPALAAVVVGSLVAWAFRLPVYYVEVPTNLLSDIHLPTMSLLNAVSWKPIIQYGSANCDRRQCGKRCSVRRLSIKCKPAPPHEIRSGVVRPRRGQRAVRRRRALPMTGVIVRSSANVQAGGKTRLSTMLHGLWLLIFVAGMAVLLRQIPTSCLAAILVYTGYKLIDIKAMPS